MQNKRAILYSAYGKEYVAEALDFASRTRESISGDIKLILDTDQNLNEKDIESSPFNYVNTSKNLEKFKNTNLKYGCKIQSMIDFCKHEDFDRFLFLDTDAYIVTPKALEVFDLLDRYDIAMSHSPMRHSNKTPKNTYENMDPLVPSCFPEFNTGVIVFKKNCLDFLQEWLNLYMSSSIIQKHDQPSLRRVAYFTDLRIATLPEEYNFRASLAKLSKWHTLYIRHRRPRN